MRQASRFTAGQVTNPDPRAHYTIAPDGTLQHHAAQDSARHDERANEGMAFTFATLAPKRVLSAEERREIRENMDFFSLGHFDPTTTDEDYRG